MFERCIHLSPIEYENPRGPLVGVPLWQEYSGTNIEVKIVCDESVPPIKHADKVQHYTRFLNIQ